MAVHPYPRRWVQRIELGDAASGLLRPIRPDDARALQGFVRSLSEQARYMRFVSMMRELTPRMLSRYTHVDYNREIALVATCKRVSQQGHPHEVIIGLAHYLRNPDGQGAEYALVIADDWQGRGLGRRLMTRLIEAAREQGLTYIEGLVLSNNRPMLSLMTQLGMVNDPDPDDSSMRRVWLSLI
jgi:acetyltransferase